MTFDDYQAEVDKLLKNPERSNLELLCGQLCSEAGEVFGKLTKINRLAYKIKHFDDGDDKTPTNDQKLAWKQEMDSLWNLFWKEIGDTQFYLAAICLYSGHRLGDHAENNIKKLNERLEAGTLTSGSGDVR